MTARACLFLVALGAVIAVPAGTAADNPKFEDLAPIGQPKGHKKGLSSRYAIWYADGWWHVRTTTGAKGAHTFTGTLEVVGGKMTALRAVEIEGKRAKKASKTNDAGTWNAAKTVFDFRLSTNKGYEDGFDLQVSDKATALKLTLKVDGEEAPKKIFIGIKGEHPKAATFYLPARPGK